MQKEWKIAKKLPEKIFRAHKDIDEVLLQLLYNRGIFEITDSKNEVSKKVDAFLNPLYEDLHDPFLLKDLKKAVKRIEQAIKNKEKIVIYGDYDADGVTSTTLLFEVFGFLGVKVFTYIPHRDKEGYGLNIEALKKISRKKATLIITVDCGIRNLEEVKEAKKMGMDIIITDHHEVPEKIPNACAVVNPKRQDCKYPFKMLAGVGVAFKLAQGLIQDMEKSEAFLKWLLDLVVIGTIGDCAPLVDENRIFAKFGMIVFKKSKRPGIIALKKSLKVGRDIDLGFYLAPRLNSAGRMDHANWAFKLLETKSPIEALKLALKIEDLNKKRQLITNKIYKEAINEIKFFLKDKRVIILSNEDWPAAVTGIVAGRLAEDLGRPVLISEKGKEFSKGSGRSFGGFNINEALQSISNLFEKVGGHKQAVGFTFKTKNFDLIEEKLEKMAAVKIKEKPKGKLVVDAEIKTKDINSVIYGKIKLLEPFGEGNSAPIFILKNVNVIEKRLVGSNKHLKLRIRKDGRYFEVIAFRQADFYSELEDINSVNLVFRISENNYLGSVSLQLEAINIAKNMMGLREKVSNV